MENPVLNALDFLKVNLPEKPKLASWISVVDIGDSRLQFKGNDFMFSLNNELLFNAFLEIYELLDGNHSLESIINSGGGSCRPTTLEFLLKTLFANGLIFENSAPEGEIENCEEFSGPLQFISRFTSTPFVAFQKIRASNIAVVGPQEIEKELNSSLLNMGFQKPRFFKDTEALALHQKESNTSEDFDLVLGMSINLEGKYFDPLNALCHETGTRFFCLAVDGDKAVLGPTVIPFQSPCTTCLESRYFSHESAVPHLPDVHRKLSSGNGQIHPVACSPLLSVVCGEAVLEITRFLTGIAPPGTIGGVYEFSGHSPVPKRHQILKVPRCRTCGANTPTTKKWDK